MIFKEYVVKDLHFLTVLKEKCVVVIGEEDIYWIRRGGLTYSNCIKGEVCGGEDDIYGICSEGLTCSNCNRCTGCSYFSLR